MTMNELRKKKLNKGCITERIEMSADQIIESIDEEIERKIVKGTDYSLSGIKYEVLDNDVTNNTVILDVTAQAEKLGVAIDTLNLIIMNKDTQLFTCSASHKEETERLFKQCIARNEEILQPKNRLDNESLENCIKNGMYKCPETNIVVALSHSPELPLVLRKL